MHLVGIIIRRYHDARSPERHHVLNSEGSLQFFLKLKYISPASARL